MIFNLNNSMQYTKPIFIDSEVLTFKRKILSLNVQIQYSKYHKVNILPISYYNKNMISKISYLKI